MSVNQELSQIQVQNLLKRLPSFELSYETIAHKKVFPSYNVGIAIPSGKKCYAWFSFNQSNDVCYIMELNREKKISKVSVVSTGFNPILSRGTLIYGTIVNADASENTDANTECKQFFIIEELYYYKGIPLKNMPFGEKLGYIEDMLSENMSSGFSNSYNIVFTLPFIWALFGQTEPCENSILAEFETHKEIIAYPCHHIQIRKLADISPYINISFNTVLSRFNLKDKPADIAKTGESNTVTTRPVKKHSFVMDYNKPQYRYATVFQVMADIEYDIYHLYAYGRNREVVYYDIACIQSMKTCLMMNSLFRNIRENKNIDFTEESDDEEDFEDISEDKYVHLDKVINMECVFHPKFKRWVPLKQVESGVRIVNITQLVNGY